MKRFHSPCSLALVWLIPPAIGFAESPDDPLPDVTAEQLAEKIESSSKRYLVGELTANLSERRNTNFIHKLFRNDKDYPPIFIEFESHASYLSNGTRWKASYEGMLPVLGKKEMNPHAWTVGFDGTEYYSWKRSRNTVELGEEDASARAWTFQSLFWPDLSRWTERLRGDPCTIDQTTIAGFRCYRVTNTRSSETTVYKYIATFSPRQSYLPVENRSFQNGALVKSRIVTRLAEGDDGYWFPSQIKEKNSSLKQDEQIPEWEKAYLIEFSRKRAADSKLGFSLPFNVNVDDRRTGIVYYNDAWWPELGPFLERRFRWPKPSLSKLEPVNSPETSYVGRAALPVTGARWINSPPLDWAKLRGKVTLIEFWGTWCPPCRDKIPALRRLYEIYHPSGFEIVAVHTASEDIEEIESFCRRMRITYPIVVDQEKGGESGETCHRYGIDAFPSGFLVGHDGRVQRIPTGKFVDKLVELLTAAGATDAEKISVKHPSVTRGMTQLIQQNWVGWAKESERPGKITGTVTDGSGKPIADATVQAQLFLKMLNSDMPSSYQLIRYPGPALSVETDSSGNYQFDKLLKGTYQIRVSAENRASVNHLQFIASDQPHGKIVTKMSHLDFIRGTVVDRAGKPIAGAAVTLTIRHPNLEEPDRTRQYIRTPTRTNDQGRFRFQRLDVGAYTMEAVAQGYPKKTVEKILIGTEKLTIRLEKE